jgi:hypothetical protein
LGFNVSDVLFSTTFACCPSFQKFSDSFYCLYFFHEEASDESVSEVKSSSIMHHIPNSFDYMKFDLDVMRCFTNFYFFSCDARGLKF